MTRTFFYALDEEARCGIWGCRSTWLTLTEIVRVVRV